MAMKATPKKNNARKMFRATPKMIKASLLLTIEATAKKEMAPQEQARSSRKTAQTDPESTTTAPE